MQMIFRWSLSYLAVFDAGTGKCQTSCGKIKYMRQFRPKTPLVVLRKMNKVLNKQGICFLTDINFF